MVDAVYQLVGSGRPESLREALPENRQKWDTLTSTEQQSILWTKIESISWTNGTGQARLRLRTRAGSPEPESLIIFVRKKSHSRYPRAERSAQSRMRTSLTRITRLMSLAIRFEELLRKGIVQDYSQLAGLGGVSRARVTQIMNLRNLAPAIQDRLLFLQAGKELLNERAIRRIAAENDWRRQLKIFDEVQTTVV